MTVMSKSEFRHNAGFAARHKKLLITLAVILFIIIALVASYFIIIKLGERRLRNRLSFDDTKLPPVGTESVPEEADAYYNGVAYNYNEDLINVLVIGVDRAAPNDSVTHQADSFYLFSLDPVAKKANIVAVSRNTMAEIDIYDSNNRFLTTSKAQLCLAYSYGTTAKQSSDLTVKAVSKLFYNLPISGYYAIYMDAVPEVMSAVGKVPVRLEEDLTAISPEMKNGAEVWITSKNVLRFLRYRKASNEVRSNRQQKFLMSFAQQAKSAMRNDLSLPVKLYKRIAKNTVTDIDVTGAAFLASEALGADFQFRSVQGTVGAEGNLETFTIDENQFYQLLLDVFYKEIK
ncbi:MAG: LCP family protein [Clostridia bacterium]|nr:LCP family protein [Clostridia bacterium]